MTGACLPTFEHACSQCPGLFNQVGILIFLLSVQGNHRFIQSRKCTLFKILQLLGNMAGGLSKLPSMCGAAFPERGNCITTYHRHRVNYI